LYAAEKKHTKKVGIHTHLEITANLWIIKISLKRFSVKGPPKFSTMIINHHKVKWGFSDKDPLTIIILREWVRSYNILAPLNIPEEVTPWAIIIITPPKSPAALAPNKTAITIPICTTEEYAILTFKSNVRKINTANSPPPIKETLIRIFKMGTLLTTTGQKMNNP